MDVVTLLPSATEMVAALGVMPVGTSHECDHPPGVEALPDVNRSRVDADASSAEINEQVAAAERGDGVYEIRGDVLEDLDPDLIVTQGICDVCAVDSVLVEEVVAERDLDAEVVTSDPHRLEDLYDDLRTIGAALDRERAAEDLVWDLQTRVQAVESRTGAIDDRPTVAVLDWLDPVMVAGHWIPELVELAGGEYPMEAPGERSRPREWTELQEADPEVVLVAPCGFSIEQTGDNLGDLTRRDGWSQLQAVRNGRVYVVDGHHYVNRPGPRLVDTLEHVEALLYPDHVDAPPDDVAKPLPKVRGRRA